LFPALAFEVEFLNPASIHDDDTRFFGVRGVDEHLLCHRLSLSGSWRAQGAAAGLLNRRAARRQARPRWGRL
jgi:hypothetical protein